MSQRGRTINPLATEIAARFEVRTGCWHERFANVRGLVPTLRPVAAKIGRNVGPKVNVPAGPAASLLPTHREHRRSVIEGDRRG